MIHSEGIGTIPVELLPENLKEKYDLGANALLPLIEKAHTSLLAKKDGKEQVVVKQPAAAPVAEPEDSAKLAANIARDDKVKGIKVKIAQLDSQISSYAAMRDQYNRAAQGHHTLAANAQGRGTPSTRHTANANESLAQAAAVERQIEALREEQKKLRRDIEYALKN